MDRQRFGYCGHENKNINMQSIKIGKSFFYNPAAAWFPRPQASHRVPFVWNFASDALEIMNIECLAFMIRPNFKRLQKSLKSQVNWSYQLENLIQKWMRRSEHSYFQKCHRLSKVPRRDISQLTTGQTFRNVKLIRIFFSKIFFCSVGLTAKYPILMQRPEVQCDKIVVTAIAIVYTSAAQPVHSKM